MLVSKKPYVVAARQNLTLKNPHLALKTGEKSTQNLRLKSLILSSKNKERSCYLACYLLIFAYLTFTTLISILLSSIAEKVKTLRRFSSSVSGLSLRLSSLPNGILTICIKGTPFSFSVSK